MIRLWLFFTFLFLATAGDVLAQAVGDSEEVVVSALGEPSMARTTGDRKILIYSDGTKIVLEAGVVVEASGPTTTGQSSYRNHEVESERPSRVRDEGTTRSSRSARTTRGETECGAAPSGAAVFFLVVGLVITLACSVLFIIAAFSESVLWGLGVLFVPFVSFIFLILHWSAVKKSFLVSLLVGFPMLVIGLALLQPN